MQDDALIDLDHLDKYVVGDTALRDEILTIFVDQARMLLEQFKPSQTDEGWKNTAHALKGAARGVGAWKLGDLCEEAETFIAQMPGKSEHRASTLIAIRHQVDACVLEAERLRAA